MTRIKLLNQSCKTRLSSEEIKQWVIRIFFYEKSWQGRNDAWQLTISEYHIHHQRSVINHQFIIGLTMKYDRVTAIWLYDLFPFVRMNISLDCYTYPIWYILVWFFTLTHWGLVTPFGDIDPGQHWLRQWLVALQHQAITWANVDLSSVRSSGIHLRAIS